MVAVPAAEGLDGGLVLEEGHHDVAVAEGLLLVDHHVVPGKDAGVEHGLAPDPEGKVLPGEAAGVEGEVVLDVLLGQDGGTGGHVAHHGDLVFGGLGGAAAALRGGKASGHGDGPGLALGLGDDAGLLQALEVEVDGGGGF